MRFGLRIPPCAATTEVVRCVRLAEDAGFDIAWIPDSQFIWRDVWASMTLAATRTNRITLGSCVTNFETRHPSVTAAAAATTEELAPDRVILGVGTGDSSIKTLGLRPTRLARMREQIQLVRDLLSGRTVAFDDRAMQIKAASGRAVPVYLAATGPKALELGGEVADGVIVLAGFSPELIERARSHVAIGAARAGRSMADIDLCFGTFCHITDDARQAARIVKPYVVGIAQNGGSEALRSIGIDVDVPRVVAGVYPDMSHAEDWDAAAHAAGRWVTDEMGLRYAQAYCLVGSAEYCRAQIEKVAACGVDNFYIRHFSSYTLPFELAEAFGSSVIPKLTPCV